MIGKKYKVIFSLTNMKKIGIFLFSLLILITSAGAFEYEFAKIKETAFPGESLIYKIIFPEGQTEEHLQLSCMSALIMLNNRKYVPMQCSITPYWIVLGGEEKATKAIFYVPENALEGSFDLKIDAWSRETKETTIIDLPAKIIKPSVVGGKKEEPKKLNVKITSLELPEEVDPRNSFLLVSYIKNSEETVLPAKIKVKIYKEKTIYEHQGVIELDGLKTTKFEKTITFKPKESPEEYFVEFTVYYENKVLSRVTKTINIISYSSVQKQEKTSSSLFGKEVVITLKNTGTGKEIVEAGKDLGILEWLLTTEISGAPRFTGAAVVWKVEVPAGEEIKVHYKTTYVPLLIFPFIVLAIGWVMWWTDRKVDIKKELDYKVEDQKIEGKVFISFKNITKKPIENIELEEEIPGFVSEVGEFGTAKPLIKKEGKNAKLVWKIKTAHPKEERIYSYKFRTKLGVLGKISLPPSTLRFAWKKSEVERRSNIVSFINEA